jgi:hypothetical protein
MPGSQTVTTVCVDSAGYAGAIHADVDLDRHELLVGSRQPTPHCTAQPLIRCFPGAVFFTARTVSNDFCAFPLCLHGGRRIL